MKAQGTDSVWTVITGGFFASVAYLMGGVDKLLVCLAIMMIIDYLTGVFIAFTNKNISSHKAFIGIAKKITMLLFVIVANQVDLAFPNQEGQLRYYILMLLIATEGISLTENFGKMGLPVPAIWLAALESIKAKTGIAPTPTNTNEKDDLNGKI